MKRREVFLIALGTLTLDRILWRYFDHAIFNREFSKLNKEAIAAIKNRAEIDRKWFPRGS